MCSWWVAQFLALEYILPDVLKVSRANVIIGGNWKIPSEMCIRDRSAVKSSNCSMGHLPWNREITGWTASHEIVKSQHEPIAMKMSNCSMGLLPWNRQITAWIIWREIIKLQHGLDLENILGDVLLVIRAKILFVWIKDIFSMMCFWWDAPQYSLFGFRTYSPWCALDESRQKIIFWL